MVGEIMGDKVYNNIYTEGRKEVMNEKRNVRLDEHEMGT
jgi:hypothetical protein